MPHRPASSNDTRIALCFIAAALSYLISETVAAAAWSSPHYSYARNYISDLGISGCGFLFHGRAVCSPLYPLMNAGFIVEGLLYAVACVLWSKVLPSLLSRGVALLAGIVYGAGMLMVGLFHGSPIALTDGTLKYHFLGAVMAIATGNLFAIGSGLFGRRLGWSGGVSIVCVLLGVVGLACALLLLRNTGIPAGIPERGSVYTIMVWEIVVGVTLLTAQRRSAARRPFMH